MFSTERFVDFRLAIGEMVVRGVQVKVSFVESNEGRSKTCLILDAATDKQIVFTFRDGATFKVKTEAVQDYLDDRESNGLKDFKL